ncbi:CGNR zinc finger domain-containing protein [Kocuria turfanensis]|uniref:CGNR zinc finger domain-containing protein n=1 Tax=Kocuria turfanensis TaxID=388357 RepID=UPI004035A35B
MHFAYDTEDVLEFDVALLNTAPGASRSGEEELAGTEQLRVLLEEHGWSGRFDRDEQELSDVLGVRHDLRRIWALERDAMVAAVNAVLDTDAVAPQLARHDGKDWHLHASPSHAPLATRLRLESAFALVDVIRADETDRLRVCEAEDCEGVLLDLSRNRSKRFCSQRCANRTNMTAYRRRRAEDAGPGGGEPGAGD